MLGSVDRSHVFRLIDALAQGDGRIVVETSEQLRHNGLSAASTLEEMCSVLQRMAVLQAVPDMPLDASDPEAAEVDRLAALMPRDETQLLYSICLHGRTELGLAPDEYAALTMALLRLLAFKPENAEAGAAEKKTPAFRPSRPIAPAIPLPAAQPVAVAQPPVQVAVPEPLPAAEPVAAAAPAEALHAVEAVEAVAIQQTTPVAAVLPVETAPASAPVAQQADPEPVAAEVAQADEAEDQASAAAEPSDEPGPDEGAWAGMPDEGWADEGRWSDDAEPDVGLPAEPMPQQEEPAGQEAAAVYVSTAQEVVPVERTPEGDLWQGVVQQLLQSEGVVALARQLALQSQLIAREGDQWTLRVESSSLNQSGARERLRAALEAAGHARQLQVEQGAVSDSPARRLAVENHARQNIAEDIVKSNSLVQTLMRDFAAKIVPGSIKPISIRPE
jgi:DNA polymerase-3 subunit gamma/tau